jgi:hypothetical protein
MTGTRRRIRRPDGNPGYPVRSARISDDVWDKAQRRATYEGVTMSQVIHEFVDGYGSNLVDLPKVEVTFAKPRTAAVPPA